MVVANVRTTIHTMKADYLTPVSIYKKLKGSRKFLLESSSKYEQSGRYSFIGANPRKVYFGDESTLHDLTFESGKQYAYDGPLIAALKQVMPRVSSITQFPFIGGAIGYIDNYSPKKAQFHIYDTVVIFDHIQDEVTIVHTNISAEHQQTDINSIIEQLQSDEKIEATTYELGTLKVTEQHELTASFTGDSFQLYRNLRIKMPGAYMYYIQFDDHTLIGSSKENFLAVTDAHIQTPANEAFTSALKKVATQLTQHEQLTAQLLPGLHSLDALQALLQNSSIKHAIGYIGFNGQIDFTVGDQVIRIEQQILHASASASHFNSFETTLQQLKG